MLAILTTHPIQYQVPLWQALAKDGRVPFEVWYLTLHGTQPSHDREFGKEFAWDLEMLSGYPHRFLDVASGATPSSFWKCRLKEKLRDRIRKSGTRALWIQGWQVAAYWQAAWEAKAAGVEVWLRGESNDLAPTPWWKSPVKHIALGRLFDRIDRFLYIGSANRRLYQKFAVPNEKLFPAPYAVDNQRFAEQAEALRGQRSVVRGQWSIPNDAFCVLFCGKFIPKKRPMDLIAAVRLLGKERGAGCGEQAKIHLLFAGSGELGDALRSRCDVVFDADAHQRSEDREQTSVASSQLPAPGFRNPSASFAGFLNQTEISKAYDAADVLVLPSDYHETWGLVVNEAMASGLPCIVSDQCGCAEDLGKISSNAIYECGNIKSLATELTTFAKHGKREVFARDLQYYSFDETVKTVADIWSR
ncbi:MAG TPA: glycosyltransferase family 4 protein [Chthoniobacterales bacterium]|jgi:glycosyltransferase involved in cell wall biosynthesis|nr:glycosyltransferase family 4 protein [Chthoniobacterales bacterium]